MVTRRIVSTLGKSVATAALALAALAPSPAHAEAVPATESSAAGAAPTYAGAPAHASLPRVSATPAIHHAPLSVAPAHQAVRITAAIDYPHLIRRALLVYRAGAGAVAEVPFMRSGDERYVAVIPEERVVSPGLGYTLEVEPVSGGRVSVFASRDQMHAVQVPEDIADLRERALLAQLEGRRSAFSASFEYVTFGKTTVGGVDKATGQPRDAVVDDYLRTEGVYTYRPLRSVVEFSIRAGVVRGRSPVPGSALGDEKYKVGLNYAAPTVLVRLADLWHLEGELLTSVTEVGFSSGVGGALHIGEVYGSKLVVGFETVKTFGTRVYTRLDIATGRLRVSPIIEVTDMPHADRAGVRLLAELAFRVGDGWSVSARGGYQARDFKSGGAGVGLSASYAF